MPANATFWTPEMVIALPEDGNRYECIDGELLVTPAPRPAHQYVLLALFRRLDAYLLEHRAGVAICVDADIQLDQHVLVQPDLFVLPPELELAPVNWREVRSLLLAVEVLSPRTAQVDRGKKRRYFQRAGVPEYWIVDADARLIERWRPGDRRPEILDASLEWQPDPAQPALQIDVQSLFSAIPKDDT